ncbi:hypothetical protein B0J18DRAFT_484504 [Chaetomium sp. MPI-SDFR-AT-0129]|nr:hypothetical protein B0J18DRAFT_484504 [Chaetomium sp. MPI-SDFR-AT-0129]
MASQELSHLGGPKKQRILAELFAACPGEIQEQILLHFVRHPQFHVLKTAFSQFRTNVPWSLRFTPVVRAFDKSGYRQYDHIGEIRPFTRRSMHIEQNNQLRQGYHDTRLPFIMLTVHANGHDDLIVLELSARPTRAPPSFDPTSALALQFEGWRLIRTFPRVENLAFKWFYHGHSACAAQATFNCRHQGKEHAAWKMCPAHLAPFLHFFPSLRQLHFILELDKSKWTKFAVDTYIKNYFTTKRGKHIDPNGRPTRHFYGTDTQYIPVYKELLVRLNDDGTEFLDLWLREVGPVENMLACLREAYRADQPALPNMLPWDPEGWRMLPGKEKRAKVTFGILIAAPDDQCVEWEGQERVDFVRLMRERGVFIE